MKKLLLKFNPHWIVLFLSGLNLLFMHYSIFFTDNENPYYPFGTYIDNILGIVADIGFVFFIAWLFSLRRTKVAVLITFYVTLLWSFSNVLYFRFFHYYISLSAIGQGGTLFDVEMINCLVYGLRWTDCYYLIILFALVLITRKTSSCFRSINRILKFILLFVGIYIVSIFYYYTHVSRGFRLYAPKAFVFRRGSIMSLMVETSDMVNGGRKLTEEQIAQIEKEIETQMHAVRQTVDGMENKNVIFIIVESYMSFVSYMKVDGKEVTPFLNALKCDTATYYNGQMNENVTIGESSDGQFLYMTGILPLRSQITISIAHNNVLPGLPQVLGRESRMVIPTKASMWCQDEMCQKYGFEELVSSSDYTGENSDWLIDEEIFQLAMQRDKTSKQPFFSVILTLSMHQPYVRQKDTTFPISKTSIPDDALASYLNECHYTDRQIGMYFDHLKRTGLYDNSIIIIAADHSVHITDFGGVSKNLPFYLINIPASLRSKMWKGECNQIDLYPTLLDVMGCESNWYGVGNSLLSQDYQSLVPKYKWEISEWILMSNYFSKQRKFNKKIGSGE
ncbi:MAG: sulfatase-like hydrolase/transferase [Prevotella sp.]|nr:sulfatase-like hydrolase/transferase [Prevotella sp.]